MSKTKRVKHKRTEIFEEDDDYGYVKHNFDRVKKKRFDHALKTLDIEELMENDDFEEGWG